VGNAQIVPEATLALAAATNVTLAAAGKLTLAAEPAAATPPPAEKPSVLSFAHASTSILTLGDTVITGGNAANTLTAHDAAVTFARNAITGATEGAKLASGGGTTAVAITVAAAGSLTLDGVNLDLSAADTGSLVLTGGGADGSVILKGGANPGKITVANTTTPITWDTNVKGKYLDDSAQKAQITGTGGVAVGSADSATANIGSISGGVLATDNDVKIAAGVNNVTITAGAALAATP
jgi:hypothetical protein